MPAGNYGPVPPMMSALLSSPRAGGLDGDLLTSSQFYQTDYTKPLLFLADGGLLADRAQQQHLLGEQWGMMNETGSYPGQVWLWLYTFWYQIAPFSTSSNNADMLVMLVMGFLSLAVRADPVHPRACATSRARSRSTATSGATTTASNASPRRPPTPPSLARPRRSDGRPGARRA